MEKYRILAQRFIARWFDALLFNIPIFIINRLIYPGVENKGVLILWLLISSFAFPIYMIIMHSRYGQTLGKKILGILVLDSSEKYPPTWIFAFRRELINILIIAVFILINIYTLLIGVPKPLISIYQYEQKIYSLLFLVWIIIDIIPLQSSKNFKRRTIHDYLGNTVVVQKLNV